MLQKIDQTIAYILLAQVAAGMLGLGAVYVLGLDGLRPILNANGVVGGVVFVAWLAIDRLRKRLG